MRRLTRSILTRSILTWAMDAVACVALVLTIAPGLLGLSTAVGFAHILAFRLLFGLGLIVVGAIAGILVALLKARRGFLVVPAVAAAVGLVQVAIVMTPGQHPPAASNLADDVFVMATLNTQVGEASPAEIARLVIDSDADAIALPETDDSAARQTARLLATTGTSGETFQVFTLQVNDNATSATSLLVSSELGAYRLDPEGAFTSLGTVSVQPVNGVGPTIAAVHTSPPIPVFVGMDEWATDVETAAARCGSGSSILAGDFNATLDHAALALPSGCADAASAVGNKRDGTWPAMLPAGLASSIDHVLFDSTRWLATETEARRVGNTDHRALIARLTAVTDEPTAPTR